MRTLYDSVGNRTTEITTAAGITTTDTLGYPATSNKIANMTRQRAARKVGAGFRTSCTPKRAATLRSFVHDAGGNITSDTRSGTAYAYTYNNRNRLTTATVAASLKGTYTYNAKEQLSIRVTSNMTPAGTTHFIQDLNGNVIAETAGGGPTGATGTVREYIYLPETEIAPAADGRTRVVRPLAVVNAVNTATPATYYVHSLPRRRPGSITLGSSPRASLNRPSCRRQASNRVDDGQHQGPSLGGGVAGLGWLVLDHRPAGQRYAVSGTVVPVRIRLALQLAPALRSEHRSVYPTRSIGLRRWAECVWVCEGTAAERG